MNLEDAVHICPKCGRSKSMCDMFCQVCNDRLTEEEKKMEGEMEMKFKEFTRQQIQQALIACSNKRGMRCSSCPIFGKGFQRNCTQLLMQRAARIIEQDTQVNQTPKLEQK